MIPTNVNHSLGLYLGRPQTRLEKMVAQYVQFWNQKWFDAHNILSEILNGKILGYIVNEWFGLIFEELCRQNFP